MNVTTCMFTLGPLLTPTSTIVYLQSWSAMAQKKPIYTIGPFKSSSENKDTTLTIHVSNKRFNIGRFSSTFESSPTLLAEYLRQIQRQEPEWIPEESDLLEMRVWKMLDKMHGWILQSFMPIFQEIPPLDPTHEYNIEDCLFSEEFPYTVKVVEDNMVQDGSRWFPSISATPGTREIA